IASVAIIDRQLPFEYTIASRSTDVIVMALPVQTINHSAFRVEKKLFVNEQPLPAAPAADSEAQEEGKSVSSNVLKMKGYVEQLERLGYVLSQDISVGLIFNGLTSDFAGFVRNYNMHNMGKTIGELHALLIEYGKGLPKKAATSQVMAIQGGKIQKANKKSLNAKGKEEFVQRFKTENRHVKGATECMKISGFMYEITNLELIKRLHDKIPKLVDEMMRVTAAFLRKEVAASNQARKKVLLAWKQQEARRKQNFDRRGDFRNQ
ncbi:hypothetical protein Tco_0854768, partial [Tanacetum coccineum]